jgi:hypothetical protein
MIRNALEKDKCPTPPAGSGLLSSDEFEAAFGDGEEEIDGTGAVRMSVEEESTTTTRSTRPMTTSSVESRNTSPANGSGSSGGTGHGAHWEAKRATKRKLQVNATKAKEARRRKLDEAGQRTV